MLSTPASVMVVDDERQLWRTEGGEYNILIGSSSETILLSERVIVNEDPRSMAPLFNRMSPLKQFLRYPKARELVTHTFAGMPRAALFLDGDEMFTSMPIGKMVVLGILTDEKVDTLIEQANQGFSI